MQMMNSRQLTHADWDAVRRIYQQGIDTGIATFEQTVPDWSHWDTHHMPDCRLVAVDAQDTVLAWAALTAVSHRCVYGGVAEVSIYVAAEARGAGIGTRLLGDLVAASEQHGLWTLQATILSANAASIHLHEKCGFRVVGTRERIAQLNGTWRDTTLMERRSDTVGV